MKIRLLQVGKTQQEFIREGVALYENRVRKYLPFEAETLPAVKLHGNAADLIRLREGEILLKTIKPDDCVILLDENGRKPDSRQFARLLDEKMTGVRQLVFIVGGAYGFSDPVYRRANETISLSHLTFSHQLVRLVFMEQLYRALTILNNHPYHHD